MKTNLDEFFKTDAEAEKNGKWFDLNKKISFLLRPFKGTNPRVKAAIATHYKPYARQIEMDTLDPVKDREIKIKLFITVCMVDWKGIEVDGKPFPYSPENALTILTALPDCFETLWKYVNDFDSFKEELGNS